MPTERRDEVDRVLEDHWKPKEDRKVLANKETIKSKFKDSLTQDILSIPDETKRRTEVAIVLEVLYVT